MPYTPSRLTRWLIASSRALVLLCCVASARAEYPEYEYVVSLPAFYMSQNYVVEPTLADAISKSVQEGCQSYYSGCSATNIGQPYYSGRGTLWYIDYVFVAFDTRLNFSVSSHGWVTLTFVCPSGGWTADPPIGNEPQRCKRLEAITAVCDECEAANHEPVPSAGNPIMVAAQIKKQVEVDYENASGTLRFVRTYRSDSGFWTNNFDYRAYDYNNDPNAPYKGCYLDQGTSVSRCFPYVVPIRNYNFVVRRAPQKEIVFGGSLGYVPPVWINDAAWAGTDAGGNPVWFVRNTAEDSVEMYANDGRLLSSTRSNGQRTTFTYSDLQTPSSIAPSPGLLIAVTDHFGHSLQFRYQTQVGVATTVMSAMIDPDGHEYNYTYDSAGNVTSVTYPDGKVRSYVYNEAQFMTNMPYATGVLTGIIDENNVRFATFTYDSFKAVSTEHAGGVSRYTVSGTPTNRSVTDPLGTTRTYASGTSADIPGRYKVSTIQQPSSNGVASSVAVRSYSYDSHGNVSKITDFDGSVTNFVYDLNRNLELSRTEAAGTAAARTITTEWHGSLRRPMRIAEPKRITTFTYDAGGNVLTKSIQATLDATGANGFNATPAGSPRTWTYTYNMHAQLASRSGPRAGGTVNYTYDGADNLASMTDAHGHSTSLSGYDNSGRVGHVVTANGKTIDYSYTPRGWVSSVVETAGPEQAVTSFEYDGAGQLTRAVLSDGSYVSYTYDPAHRLTGVADSAGNSTVYTLDNAGNRLSEQSYDSAGTLSRKITRVFNALSMAKQVTGAL